MPERIVLATLIVDDEPRARELMAVHASRRPALRILQ
jgi:hypothetical protein